MIRFPNVARPPRSVYRRLNIASGDQRPFDDPLAFTQSGPTCNRSADTPGVSCAYRSRHQPNQRRPNSCPPASFSAPAVGNPVLCSTLPHPCTCTPNPLPAHHPILSSSTTNLPLQPTQPQQRQRRIICAGWEPPQRDQGKGLERASAGICHCSAARGYPGSWGAGDNKLW
jgi:hypothetical protein